MTRWVRSYWAEGDVTYYFEVGEDAWVTRQVELEGDGQHVVAAADLAEWQAALAAGRVHEYQARFGVLAENPTTEWGDWPQVDLTKEEFEQVWRSARSICE